MPLRVPPEQVPLLKAFLELPSSKVDAFLAALSAAPPVFSTFALTEEICRQLDVPKQTLDGILRILAGLYLARDREGTPLDTFVDKQILKALRSSNVFADEDAVVSDWPKLRKFFVKALDLHRSVGTASKTGHVMTQHEHIFQAVKVLTDIRPIFHPDVEDAPDAAVIVHMLRLTHRNNQREQSDIFFAMDSNDIRALQAAIERAMNKEATIKKALSKAAIECIEPKEVY